MGVTAKATLTRSEVKEAVPINQHQHHPQQQCFSLNWIVTMFNMMAVMDRKLLKTQIERRSANSKTSGERCRRYSQNDFMASTDVFMLILKRTSQRIHH